MNHRQVNHSWSSCLHHLSCNGVQRSLESQTNCKLCCTMAVRHPKRAYVQCNLKSTIQKVYLQINKSDNVSKNYNEIHDALITLNNALQQAALKKTYHFSPAQNKIIHEINSVEHKSFWQQISTIINGPAFFHS